MKLWYQNKTICVDNEWKKKFDTPELRKYSGRRMAILINKPKIRRIMANAKHINKQINNNG